jgi:hypothetical protein
VEPAFSDAAMDRQTEVGALGVYQVGLPLVRAGKQ